MSATVLRNHAIKFMRNHAIKIMRCLRNIKRSESGEIRRAELSEIKESNRRIRNLLVSYRINNYSREFIYQSFWITIASSSHRSFIMVNDDGSGQSTIKYMSFLSGQHVGFSYVFIVHIYCYYLVHFIWRELAIGLHEHD